MVDLAEFDAFIGELVSASEGAPPWRFTEAERVLASFGRAMNDAATDGMSNVVWSTPEEACRYADAFEAMGAVAIAAEIRLIAAQDEYSGFARRRLSALNKLVQAQWKSLWSMALEYAGRHNAFPRQD